MLRTVKNKGKKSPVWQLRNCQIGEFVSSWKFLWYSVGKPRFLRGILLHFEKTYGKIRVMRIINAAAEKELALFPCLCGMSKHSTQQRKLYRQYYYTLFCGGKLTGGPDERPLMDAKFCLKCGKPHDFNDRYCAKCGMQKEVKCEMICPKCGKYWTLPITPKKLK